MFPSEPGVFDFYNDLFGVPTRPLDAATAWDLDFKERQAQLAQQAQEARAEVDRARQALARAKGYR